MSPLHPSTYRLPPLIANCDPSADIVPKTRIAGAPNGWYRSGVDQSCSEGCATAGLVCSEHALNAHNGDVDTAAKMVAMVTHVGGFVGVACVDVYGTSADVPQWSAKVGAPWCAHSASKRALSTFSCGSRPLPAGRGKERLCYCSQAAAVPDPTYMASPADCSGEAAKLTRGSSNDATFRCKGGLCIPLKGRCNGVKNCYDNSDEVGCTSAVEAVSGPLHAGPAVAEERGQTVSKKIEQEVPFGYAYREVSLPSRPAIKGVTDSKALVRSEGLVATDHSNSL